MCVTVQVVNCCAKTVLNVKGFGSGKRRKKLIYPLAMNLWLTRRRNKLGVKPNLALTWSRKM